MKLPIELPEEEENEFYGPIDGVRPVDHVFYRGIYEMICVTGTAFVNLREHSIDNVLCEKCHAEIYENRINESPYQRIYKHLIMTEDVRVSVLCKSCQQEVYSDKAAEDCRECIEEYLDSKNKILCGIPVEVITRW